MVRERVAKMSIQPVLEAIKDKVKQKRDKQLSRAAAQSRTTSRLAHKHASSMVAGSMLTTLQHNNRALALALQAEKAKVRQADAINGQLRMERHTLLLHLLALKRKLQKQQAPATSSPLVQASALPVEMDVASPRKEKISEGKICEVSPICAESSKMDVQHGHVQTVLPPPVIARQKHSDRAQKSRRRSDRVRSISEGMSGACVAEPAKQREEPWEILKAHLDNGVCTQDPEPPVNTRKRGHHQPKEPARKPPERAPLKKPWENPKRKVRSKSRECRVPAPKHLNTSLGFNDTFDFDCEEAVHLTPFKAKPEDHPAGPALNTPAPDAGSPSSSPSSASEDSLYLPKKKARRGHASPETTKVIITRRGQHPDRNTSMPKSVLTAHEWQQKQQQQQPNEEVDAGQSSVSSGSHLSATRQEEAPRYDVVDGASIEAEVDMAIDEVLSRLGDSICQSQSPLPPPSSRAGRHVAMRKKPGHDGSQTTRPSTPLQRRTRRSTQAVDYREPSLNAKLRRGDRFTDLKFLRASSPIYKTKSTGRRSRAADDKLDKYNEPFVSCR
ncbi:shugoshin 1 isoform X2 [Festucalex cinctus]